MLIHNLYYLWSDFCVAALSCQISAELYLINAIL